jgi:hypothetical protein
MSPLRGDDAYKASSEANLGPPSHRALYQQLAIGHLVAVRRPDNL